MDVTPVKITDMPGAMRAMGWENAAMMLEKWLNGEACQLEGKLLEQYKEAPRSIPADLCDETTVTMEWALSYTRVKEAYDKLLANWHTPNAEIALLNKLKNQLWPLEFGNTGWTARELHAHCQVQLAPFGGLWDTIDEMYGIIGKAFLYLAVVGRFTPGSPVQRNGAIEGAGTFTVTDIGIYLRDIYEFNQFFQPLGIWTKTRTYGKAEILGIGALAVTAGAGGAVVGRSAHSATAAAGVAMGAIELIDEPFSPVFNNDFRAYRKKYGKGRDFFIFSDVKWEKPKAPVVIPMYAPSYLEMPSGPVIV